MIDTAIPLPMRTELTAPYWQALERGRLEFQRCTHCKNAWLPPREECPRCLLPEWHWQVASGRGRLVSWVVYHRSYDPAFQTRTPYNVAVVELEEGPRLVTNIVELDSAEQLRIEMPVVLRVQLEGVLAVARFAPSAAEQPT